MDSHNTLATKLNVFKTPQLYEAGCCLNIGHIVFEAGRTISKKHRPAERYRFHASVHKQFSAERHLQTCDQFILGRALAELGDGGHAVLVDQIVWSRRLM